ncbi:MAG: UvrD-helicase domain-containing protein [Bacteroides sp.]|nr:UvrD-helicase domain-containing protein [Bacillota bacterium]MCM1455380.1 UvrD-helicase domain-containing protein [Bacteroides sp.]
MSFDYEQLNPQQAKAAGDTEGAILVIAGAGSGKTRVLTARICRLIEKGVSPYNILAITFTNKAASEMQERIGQAIGSASVWTSTFHSMCARILRLDGEKLGYGKDFTIYTEQESSRLVKRIMQDYPALDQKKYGDYLWHISHAKTLSLLPEDYYREIKNDVRDANEIALVYRRYEEELKRCNCLDFDDLLLKTVQLFEEYPEVLEKYQNRFRYIHVDEFQDTNALQYKLVKMLAKGSGNLFVVGDEDQSIYSWRGAEIRNILDFSKDFVGAKVYKLEQNYRSTTSILRAANNVIKHNSNRNEKTLWSDIKDDDSVEYYEAYSDRDEAGQTARAINLLVKHGSSYRGIAVLVRANSLTRQFEEEFNLHGIPYKVFGGFRFFERKEIKDTLAYVRIALNPSDNDSILRVINYPKRGIGSSSVAELQNYASAHGETFYSVLINPIGLSANTQKKFAPFTQIALDLVERVKDMKPDEFMQYVIRRSGIEGALSQSKDVEDVNRLENIQELVGAVKQFVQDNPELGISDFMQSVALVSDTDDMDGDDYVTVATVHAVKGLEFDNVFIVGMEDGIFPTQRAIASGDIEEERRLMYVAITRAKRKLFVLNARSRYRFGKVEYLPKSRFISEMSGTRASVRIANSDYGAKSFAQDTRIKLGANSTRSQSFKNRFSNMPTAPKDGEVDYDKFVKDVVVEHTKFGKGVVIMTSGDGEDKIASIAFQGLGVKRFSLAIAAPSLKIVGNVNDDI